MRPLAGVRCHLLFVATLGSVLGIVGPALRAEAEHPGRVLFVSKGCATCHEERAVLQAPHISVLRRDRSLFQLAAGMLNQAPLMWANLSQAGLRWPRLSPREMAALALYLNGSSPKDAAPDLRRGQGLLVAKGCVGCHGLEDPGQTVARDLGRQVRFDSNIAWAAAMWNHAPSMLAVAAQRRVEYPQFQPKELVDLIGFLREMGKPR